MFSRTRRKVFFLGFMLAGAALAPAGPDNPQSPRELARARAAIARRIYEQLAEELKAPPAGGGGAENRLIATQERMADWSRRWMESELKASDRKADTLAAIEAHLRRLKSSEAEFEQLVQGEETGAARRMLDELKFHRLEAESLLAEATAAR